jgi:hypothetical protein
MMGHEPIVLGLLLLVLLLLLFGGCKAGSAGWLRAALQRRFLRRGTCPCRLGLPALCRYLDRW